MFYHAASDRYIQPGQSFTLGQVQYPSNWLQHATASDKEALGISEVQVAGSHNDPLYYNNTEILSNGVLTKTSTAKTDLSQIKTQLKNQVDSTAGSARTSYLSQGDHVIREYDQAYAEAVAFKDAGYPAEAIPLSVSCWATASVTTATAAADNIIAAGNFLKLKLDQIREARLIGKAGIDSATTVTELKDAYDSSVAAIGALRNVG